jgi:hypothetical protein
MLVSTILIILISPLRFLQPSAGDCFEWFSPQVVELVSALSLSSDQTRRLKNVEVLRDALPRDADLVLHRQARAQLEERLSIPIAQLIENRSPYRCYQCFEDIAHDQQR